MYCRTKFYWLKESPVSATSVTKVDTHIFVVSPKCLNSSVLLSTGDPYSCSICQSVFNLSSKIL